MAKMAQDQAAAGGGGAGFDPATATSVYEGRVLPEWIDYNGHMNVAYYVLAFDHATDALFERLGITPAYRQQSGNTTFAVEAHITYQREVMEGDPLRIEAYLIGHDAKRLHFFHRMLHAEKGYLAATGEWLGLHIDLAARRVTPFPEEILTRLRAAQAEREGAAPPPELGRAISLSPRSL